MHVVFLVYMLIVLPVRTAFKIDPSPGTTEFAVDAVSTESNSQRNLIGKESLDRPARA